MKISEYKKAVYVVMNKASGRFYLNKGSRRVSAGEHHPAEAKLPHNGKTFSFYDQAAYFAKEIIEYSRLRRISYTSGNRGFDWGERHHEPIVLKLTISYELEKKDD